MSRPFSSSTLWKTGWRGRATLLTLLVVMLAAPASVDAHAFLDRSEPAANAVLATPPADVRMWFTEPLEPDYSGAGLYDTAGNRIATPEASVDPDDSYLLSLPLPANLPNGTYTVAWYNVSTADGHPTEGYFAFTIGAEADVAVPITPASPGTSSPPTAVEAVGRWLVLLGLMVPPGILAVMFWMISAWPGEVRERLWSLMRRVMLAGLTLALGGGIVLLIDQTITVEFGFSIAAAMDLLSGSSFGRYWLLRVLAVILLAGGLLTASRLDAVNRWRRFALVLLAVLPLLPLSLNSHAAAVGEGDAAAVIADFLHMVAGSFWIGGLVALLAGLVVLRGEQPESRLLLLAQTIPRFSTLAIASVLVLAASGLYATWLQIGNLDALRQTDYGRTLTLKLGLMLGMLCFGAVNLLVLEPRLRGRRASATEFRRTVATETLIGVTLILIVGLLTSLPTARGSIDAETGRIAGRFDGSSGQADFVIAPGAVGANFYAVDFDRSEHSQGETSVFLRFSHTGDELAGVREVELQPGADQRYEAAGSELSVVGEWDIEVILRQPGAVDWRGTARIEVDEHPPVSAIPRAAARFGGIPGALSMLLALAGIPLLVIGLRTPGIRVVAAVGGLVLVVAVAGLLVSASTPEDGDSQPETPGHHHHSLAPTQSAPETSGFVL